MLRADFEVNLFTPAGVLWLSGVDDIGDGVPFSWTTRVTVQKKGRQI